MNIQILIHLWKASELILKESLDSSKATDLCTVDNYISMSLRILGDNRRRFAVMKETGEPDGQFIVVYSSDVYGLTDGYTLVKDRLTFNKAMEISGL